jgi:hypothetical protein
MYIICFKNEQIKKSDLLERFSNILIENEKIFNFSYILNERIFVEYLNLESYS